MRRARLLCVGAVLLLLLVPTSGAVPQGGTELVLVAVEGASRVVAFEPEGDRVAARFAVPRGPRGLTLSNDRHFVLVTSPPSGSVTVIDAFRLRVLYIFRGLRSPRDAAFDSDGEFAYVSEGQTGSVAVVSLRARRTIRRVMVAPRPDALELSPGGRALWVTHVGSRRVTILDTTRPGRPRLVDRARAPRALGDLAFARDGSSIWATYAGSGLVANLHTGSGPATPRLETRVAALVERVEVDVLGRVWATDPRLGRAVRLTSAGRVAQRIGGCPGADHAAVGVGRGRVAISCRDSGELLVFDPGDRRAGRLPVGPSPRGVVVAWVP